MPRKKGPPLHVSPAMLKRHIQALLDQSYIYNDMYLPIDVTERADGTYLVEITRSRMRTDPTHLIAYLANKYYTEVSKEEITGSEHRVGTSSVYFVRFLVRKQTVETFIKFDTFPLPPVIESLLARENRQKEIKEAKLEKR